MATGEGIITRKDIITDEALAFGKEYRKNVEEAIEANDSLIKQFKTLLKVSGDYRKAQNESEYRKKLEEERLTNVKIINDLKQMSTLERELEKIKKQKLTTEREMLKVAQENLNVAIRKAQLEGVAERELEKIKQERLRTERELTKVKLENERLSKLQAQTEHSNTREIERLKQELIRTEREQTKLKQDKVRLEKIEADQVKRNTTLTMEERVQRQLANKADKEAVLEKMGLVGAYQKLNRQRTEAKKKLQDLIASEKASTAEIKRAQREFDILDKKVRQADRAVGDFSKSVGNYRTAFAGVSNILGAFGVIGGIAGMVQLGKSIYETTKLIQGQEIALKMLSETEAVYAKNKEFLVRISEQYGLELITTTDAYKNYYASAKTAIEEGRLSFDEMQTIFEKISKSSSMLGLSVDQQEGAFLAISQMMSKGTVQSEELRGQLGERLPGAFEVMAKALNVTTMELGDMLKKGEVLAADVLPKFAVAYEKAIGADQIERVETLAAAQNRASNKWTEFVENLNSGQGVISAAGMGFFNLTSNILDLIGAKESLIDKMFDEQLGVNDLINRITALNEDNSDRVKLIDELKTKYPGFIKFIKDEDFSNANLRKTLVLVNDEYRNRILLQKQVENLEAAQAKRDSAFKVAATSRLDLYNKLNEINSKNNLGFELTVENADQLADKIQSAARKSLGAWDQLRINKLQSDIKGFTEQSEEYNEVVEKEAENIKKLQEQTGLQTEAQRTQNEAYQAATKSIKELSAEANKLGLVAGKDFLEYSPSALQEAINTKKRSLSGGGESEKDRKKREAAERKAQKEAEKRNKERLKNEKDNYEAEIDLLIWRADAKSDILKAESINEKNTQDERYEALMESQQLELAALKLNVEKQLTLSRGFQEDKKAFTDQEVQDLINGVETKTVLTNQELLILEKFYAEQEKLRKQNQKGLEDNIQFEINLLKKQQESKLLQGQFSMSGELNALSIGSDLTDLENYEKAAYEIKRKYLLKEIEDNITLYESILQRENLTQSQKEENLKILLNLQEELREFNLQSHFESLEQAKEMERTFMEIGESIKKALVDLTNTIFDNRIQRIDEDIERTNEQYEKQIELYEGDAARQKAIREQQEREREKLEAKKRKEQHKQAVFNKAMNIAEIGFNTATAIMKAYADLGPIAGTVAAVLIGVLGTVQTATVLATPIPKYKMGRKGGPEEVAIVGDGGIHEVIEHKDGSAEITPKTDTLVKLLEGDVVHSSIDKYRQARRNKMQNELLKDQLNMQAYINNQTYFDASGIEKKLDDLIIITKNKNMTTTVKVPKVDIGHELWRLKQLGY